MFLQILIYLLQDPDEVKGFFNWLKCKSPQLRGKVYVHLSQLVEEGLAEYKKREMYTSWKVPEDSLLWQGRRVWRKLPSGKREKEDSGLGSLMPSYT